MIGLHWHIVNLEPVLASFERVDRGMASMQPLWERCADEFYEQETAHFARQEFAALSPSYAEKKRRKFGEKPILRATDALFLSLTQAGAANSIRRINDLEAEFGTSDPKAMWHQEGTDRMPARPPLAEPDEDRYETLAAQYLDELIN